MENRYILNGIDVEKCWHRQGITCIVSQHDFCDKHPNCYFKQLARAKDKINYKEEYIKIIENEILESIKKSNEQMAKEIKYKKALEAIEAYCNVILADRCHYSEGAILMAEKLIREYISKTKE